MKMGAKEGPSGRLPVLLHPSFGVNCVAIQRMDLIWLCPSRNDAERKRKRRSSGPSSTPLSESGHWRLLTKQSRHENKIKMTINNPRLEPDREWTFEHVQDKGPPQCIWGLRRGIFDDLPLKRSTWTVYQIIVKIADFQCLVFHPLRLGGAGKSLNYISFFFLRRKSKFSSPKNRKLISKRMKAEPDVCLENGSNRGNSEIIPD